MLSNEMGKKLHTYVPDYVVFDLETTGTNPKKDEIIEISAVKVVNSEVVEEFTSLVNPGIPIPDGASAVNHITDDMVADAPAIDVVLDEFLDFVGDMVLVGHCIHTFDMRFMYRYTRSIYGKIISNDYIDTYPLSVMYLPKLSHHTLVSLATYYDVTVKDAHRALGDCRMNQQVFEHLGEEMKKPSKEIDASKICPICGSPLKLRNGKYGEFWGCTGYPTCRFTMNK